MKGLFRNVVRTITVLAMVVAAAPAPAADNVIVMVPDGCSAAVQTAARWYKGEPLALDDIVAGAVSTYMSDSVITDSAAAATAFASGYKTSDGFVGIGPRPDTLLSGLDVPQSVHLKPIATVLEGAKLAGKAVGLVATSRITHATPASFAAHVESRNWDNDIMEQMVYNKVDVVFGGGKRHLLPERAGGRRTDDEHLARELREMGYDVVFTKGAMQGLSRAPAWGMFAESHMAADIDRPELAQTEPSIAQMTEKALELLADASPDGFFLMVEGSQVDWAGHANDPIYMITDFLAFDDAVRAALDFAADPSNGETLVIVFPDHNTGGMSIGNGTTDSSYTSVTVEQFLEPLANMKLSAWGLSLKVGADTSPANVRTQVQEWWGIDLSDDDIAEILARTGAGMSFDYALSEVVSERHTIFGWTTNGHTAEDVPLWSWGRNRPVGLYDNTDLAHLVAEELGFHLSTVDQLLFTDLSAAFPAGTVDTSDPENPAFMAHGCTLPIGKNLLIAEGMGLEFELPGVIATVPSTGKVYGSYMASALITGFANGTATALALTGAGEEEIVAALGIDDVHRTALAAR